MILNLLLFEWFDEVLSWVPIIDSLKTDETVDLFVVIVAVVGMTAHTLL